MKPLDPKSRVAPKKILLATDFSAASEAALPHALTIAGHYGSKLYVAHVICPEFMHLGHILYPVEFVPDSSDAAAYVVSLAEEFHAKLSFMKVFEDMVPSPEEKAQVQEPVRHWMDDHIPTESDLRERTSFELGFGPAAEAILKFASDRGVDLIVMGVRRLDPVMAAHLPKPDTAYEVVRIAPCPVLTVR